MCIRLDVFNDKTISQAIVFINAIAVWMNWMLFFFYPPNANTIFKNSNIIQSLFDTETKVYCILWDNA